MAGFRDKLYENYFQTQNGRRLNKDLQEKMKENHRQLAHEILPLIPDNKDINILDIGCGYGEWLLLLRSQGYANSQGVDISPEQVAMAKELGIEGVSQADVFELLQAQEAQYDIITGIDIIEHFSKDELVNLLSIIRHALKPGGKAIFRTPNMDGLLASVYAYGDFTHQCLLNYSSARQLGLACGFSEVEVLPSFIMVSGGVKELIRKFFWFVITLNAKFTLFASGRSTQGVLFTPNLLLVVKN